MNEDNGYSGSVVFHMPGELKASPALRGCWKRPLLNLLVEAQVLAYSNDVDSACATFSGWCTSNDPAPVWFLSAHSLPGLPWTDADWDPWAWYDSLMIEFARWDPPPVLVDLESLVITHSGELIWPEGLEGKRRLARRADRRVRTEGAIFPVGWFGQGLGEYRLRETTYNCYPSSELPPIPVNLTGQFDWLQGRDSQERSIAANSATTRASLKQLVASIPTGLPSDFIKFFRSPTLWAKIRSCTDCFLHLDSASSEIRGGFGRLVRFLSDSQSCIHWNLYISPCETKHGVVATYFYTGSEYADKQGGQPHPRDITWCASSFEEFVYRFWLENELWYALHDMGAMPKHGEKYLSFYRPK